MAEKMTRRTFMKSAAAAAAAISLSGVLTGCGGSGQLADDEVQIGPFTVKVFGLDVDLGTESGTDKGAITGKVRLRYDAGGGSWQGGQYGDMFQAFVGEAKLKQVSPAGTFFVSDTLLGKPFATEEKDLRLNFPDAEIKEAYRNGQPAVLKIVIKLAAAFEAVGIVLLLFAFVPQFGVEGVWVSVFTAISAFCNAGFDLFGRFGDYSSLVPYVNNYYVQAVIMFMIMAGGLGFMVWVELAEYRKKRRLSLHAKVVLQFSVIFWVGGAVLLALISWSDSNMAGICFGDSKQQAFTLAGPHVSNVLSFEDPVAPLTVGTVDEFIEYFMARHSEARVHYVHDEPAVHALTRQGGVAFLLPPFEKSDLFKGIVMGGVLPRKTFSMGHAEEKRYYIECRKITE